MDDDGNHGIHSLHLIARGAEASVYVGILEGKKVVLKRRERKRYRERSFDDYIRKRRTRQETRAMEKAASYVNTPKVVASHTYDIVMEYIDGERPNKSEETAMLIGKLLKKIHKSGVIHNDFTLANVLIKRDGAPYVIDFGLAFQSTRLEDRASDLYTSAASMGELANVVVKGYSDKEVEERYNNIRQRMRYVKE
ncbi:MAG: Kae1-associated serine/threonine protein kinase [Methanobacteriota archaeon]|nr:MAG: Kae1-associated serine/threonine protein kinase [Euryarchaeota archaeon]